LGSGELKRGVKLKKFCFCLVLGLRHGTAAVWPDGHRAENGEDERTEVRAKESYRERERRKF
jgi:hypothetical protein